MGEAERRNGRQSVVVKLDRLKVPHHRKVCAGELVNSVEANIEVFEIQSLYEGKRQQIISTQSQIFSI